MNLPEASQDAILGRTNLSIVTWKGISGQMPVWSIVFDQLGSVLISGKVLLFLANCQLPAA
jgi:hypothetical protein